MRETLEAAVPPAWAELLERNPELDDGFTMLVLTVVDGWAHQAMISVGEVVLISPAVLRLALWPTSTVTRAMTEQGRATLTAVAVNTSYSLRLRVSRGPDVQTPLSGTLARFDAEVQEATAERAPYARLDHGIGFTLNDRPAAVGRWHELREALLCS